MDLFALREGFVHGIVIVFKGGPSSTRPPTHHEGELVVYDDLADVRGEPAGHRRRGATAGDIPGGDEATGEAAGIRTPVVSDREKKSEARKSSLLIRTCDNKAIVAGVASVMTRVSRRSRR